MRGSVAKAAHFTLLLRTLGLSVGGAEHKAPRLRRIAEKRQFCFDQDDRNEPVQSPPKGYFVRFRVAPRTDLTMARCRCVTSAVEVGEPCCSKTPVDTSFGSVARASAVVLFTA